MLHQYDIKEKGSKVLCMTSGHIDGIEVALFSYGKEVIGS